MDLQLDLDISNFSFDDKFVRNRKNLVKYGLYVLYRQTNGKIDSYLVDIIANYLNKILYYASYSMSKNICLNDCRIKYGWNNIIQFCFCDILNCKYEWVVSDEYGWMITFKYDFTWTINQFLIGLKKEMNSYEMKMNMMIGENKWNVIDKLKVVIEENCSPYFITKPIILQLKGNLYDYKSIKKNIKYVNVELIKRYFLLWDDLKKIIVLDKKIEEITHYIHHNSKELYKLS